MKRTIIFLLLAMVTGLLIIYNKHLLFFFQEKKLEAHVHKLSEIYNNEIPAVKKSFCNLQPYSKVWAHRINTLERFKFLSKHFQGFEMDIVFDEVRNVFDVRHPPATSINLSFDQYLQVKESKGKLFWLDIKNLTNVNEGAILSLLIKLDSEYKIRQRIIIESDNIRQLSTISGAGFFTSFYYDWNTYHEFISSADKNTTDSIFNTIDAVSQDVLIYDTLVKHFPTKPRLTWALSIKNYFSDSLFTTLDNDTNLLVYLVNVKSPNYR